MSQRSFQWLVVRGRIGVSTDDVHVLIEIDPEGSAYCVLDTQDAREIAEIVADVAKALRDVSAKTPEPQAVVEGGPGTVILRSETGVLTLIADDTRSLVAVSYEGAVPCQLTVTQAVALVQIIDSVVDELDRAGA